MSFIPWGAFSAACLLVFSLITLSDAGTLVKREAPPPPKGPCDCMDWYGSCRKEGENWVDDATWKYMCAGGDARLVGCMATKRGGGQAIPINMNVTIGEFWYACNVDSTKGNENIKYRQQSACEKDGKLLRTGAQFRDEFFIWQCEEWGIDIVGCHFNDAELGNVNLALHETQTVGCFEHKCKKLTEFPWRIRYVAEPKKGCVATETRQKTAKLAVQQKKVHSSNAASSDTAPEEPLIPLPRFADAFFKFDDQIYNEKIRYTNVQLQNPLGNSI